MPIEIKELHIKIEMEEEGKQPFSGRSNSEEIKELKSEIVRICTRKILEELKEKQQR